MEATGAESADDLAQMLAIYRRWLTVAQLCGYKTVSEALMAIDGAVLGLLSRQSGVLSRYFSFGLVRVNDDEHRVHVAEDEITDLTLTEYRLLLALVKADGAIRTRVELQLELWGDHFVSPDVVRVHLSRLRRKLGAVNPAYAHVIETVEGVGLRMRRLPPLESQMCGPVGEIMLTGPRFLLERCRQSGKLVSEARYGLYLRWQITHY